MFPAAGAAEKLYVSPTAKGNSKLVVVDPVAGPPASPVNATPLFLFTLIVPAPVYTWMLTVAAAAHIPPPLQTWPPAQGPHSTG